ncbi:hypothetical protein Acr_03g0020050 [Actinidia rufa]|uniref:Uncharacterized protein n=1 Tax=Actinidia rufa TaxID=165716 RepID=A0A7J0EFJ2_9ERIC|nr:hypothetical protein Acr_03g0020050 [Actinidia rufa]
MQVASKACRLTRVLQPRSILLYSDRRFDTPLAEASHSSLQHRNHSTLWFSGTVHDSCGPSALNDAPRILQSQMCSMMMDGDGAKDAVKELYNKILKSIEEQRTMAPNAWLWSLIENCANHDDIKLLFDILHRLRVFRLSNLRIHANFNCNLCREITKACARVGAIDFGKKTLWKHNVYGLSPSIGSAHHLLGFLLEHKPEDATAIIQVLIQTLSDAKKPGIMVGLQKLVSEWPLEVIKHQKDEDRKALAAGLQNDIPAMVNYLLKLGLEVNVNMEDLTNKEGLLC